MKLNISKLTHGQQVWLYLRRYKDDEFVVKPATCDRADVTHAIRFQVEGAIQSAIGAEVYSAKKKAEAACLLALEKRIRLDQSYLNTLNSKADVIRDRLNRLRYSTICARIDNRTPKR